MEVTTRANISFPSGESAADASMNKAITSVHGAVDKMNRAADDAVLKIEPAIDQVAQLVHQAVDKAADVAVPTAAWLGEQGENLKAGKRKVAAEATQYVSAHPWKSVGFALAAGYLISRFMR